MDSELKEYLERFNRYYLEESKANARRFELLQEEINSKYYSGIRSIQNPDNKKSRGIGTLLIAIIFIIWGYFLYPDSTTLDIPIYLLTLNKIFHVIGDIIVSWLLCLWGIYSAFNTKWFL